MRLRRGYSLAVRPPGVCRVAGATSSGWQTTAASVTLSVVAVDLEQLVQAKVAGRLEELNGTVEQLVAQAVDRELERRVVAIVEANIEARARPPLTTQSARDDTAVRRICKSCGERPAAPGRKVCYGCRERQRRERRRREADAEAEDHSPSAST
jgi:hypothetical protein